MILKLPENRKKIIEYLENVNEDTFIEEIIIPFFGSQGYQVYRINSHGPGEHGKDIIFCRYVPIFFENEFIAVQAKAEQVTASNVTKFSGQLTRTLRTKFPLLSSGGDLYPHYAIFINARKHANESHAEFPQLMNSPYAKILCQENVCELIMQSGIAPHHLLKQLSISTPDTQSVEDKLVFETILGNNPAETDNLLDHKIKFLKDYISIKTKELIIDFIYDRWQMDRSWAGTVKPMKWFDDYFDFVTQKHSKYLLTVFEELMSSTPSFEALPFTLSIIRKITPDLLLPIEDEFIVFCARRTISYPRERMEYMFEKLKEFDDAKLIKKNDNISLAKKVLLIDKYIREKNTSKRKEIETEIYDIVYEER